MTRFFAAVAGSVAERMAPLLGGSGPGGPPRLSRWPVSRFIGAMRAALLKGVTISLAVEVQPQIFPTDEVLALGAGNEVVWCCRDLLVCQGSGSSQQVNAGEGR
jgi:hypothetical protein